MTSDAGVPGAPRFDVVLRGYDRRQVDEHVDRLQRVLARMRADLDVARSQPMPAVAPSRPAAARPRPTPRPRPDGPADDPDTIGNFTDRMETILQSAEEEAAEIRRNAHLAARAETDGVRSQVADLIRQRDTVLAELTRMRSQLEGLLAAPTAQIPAHESDRYGRPEPAQWSSAQWSSAQGLRPAGGPGPDPGRRPGAAPSTGQPPVGPGPSAAPRPAGSAAPTSAPTSAGPASAGSTSAPGSTAPTGSKPGTPAPAGSTPTGSTGASNPGTPAPAGSTPQQPAAGVAHSAGPPPVVSPTSVSPTSVNPGSGSQNPGSQNPGSQNPGPQQKPGSPPAPGGPGPQPPAHGAPAAGSPPSARPSGPAAPAAPSSARPAPAPPGAAPSSGAPSSTGQGGAATTAVPAGGTPPERRTDALAAGAGTTSGNGTPSATPGPAGTDAVTGMPPAGPEREARKAAHRLPTGAYPAVADSSSMRPRSDPDPEPADLFRPVARGAGPEQQTTAVPSSTADAPGERTSVVRRDDRTERGATPPAAESTTKVGSRPEGPTVLSPQPATGRPDHDDGRNGTPRPTSPSRSA